jgi:hypothetical protein
VSQKIGPGQRRIDRGLRSIDRGQRSVDPGQRDVDRFNGALTAVYVALNACHETLTASNGRLEGYSGPIFQYGQPLSQSEIPEKASPIKHDSLLPEEIPDATPSLCSAKPVLQSSDREHHLHERSLQRASTKPCAGRAVRDLRPVCPNCHAAIHRTEPPLTPEAVKVLLQRGQQGA